MTLPLVISRAAPVPPCRDGVRLGAKSSEDLLIKRPGKRAR